MGRNVLVINATELETRVALIEEGIISEYYVERHHDRSIVGNIYKGKVLRILPGMQAAFVDIGLDKAAFLYVADVYNLHDAYASEVAEDGQAPEIPQSRGRHRPTGPIEERLRQGQEILVQVAKEPIGTKGARVTSHITLPGRMLVFMPTFDHIGVSRRIDGESERERLRLIIDGLRRPGTGFIVRTAAEHASAQSIEQDIHYLSRLWGSIRNAFEVESAPVLLYEDLDLILRASRDLFTQDIDALIIDQSSAHTRTQEFVQRFIPELHGRIQRYDQEEPIFDAYGIEIELSRALGRKVWLPSGGYLVIDHTEALTAIDINTGKFVGKTNLEDTILRINLEAVHEIVYQLRLRTIGGLIIIDFIDMELAENRLRVYQDLEAAITSDKAKTNILEISEFGLVEMTRKRVRESLVQTLCEPCFYCEGKGYLKSSQTVALEMLRELQRELVLPHDELHLTAHPNVAQVLLGSAHPSLLDLQARYSCTLHVQANPNFHVEQYTIGW